MKAGRRTSSQTGRRFKGRRNNNLGIRVWVRWGGIYISFLLFTVFFAMPIWVYPFSNYIWKGQCCQGGLVDVCAAWCVTFLTWRSHTTPCLCLSGRHAWGPLEGCLRLVWKIKWPPLEFVVVLLTSLLSIWIAEDAVLVRFLFKM